MATKFGRLLGVLSFIATGLAVGTSSRIASAADEFDSRRLSPVVQNVADDNSCTQFTSSSFGWGTVSPSTDVLLTSVSGQVTDGTNPVANAIVTSGMLDTNFKLGKITCAVTDSSGNYTIQVLRAGAVAPFNTIGQLTVSPPNVSKLESNQLGSQTKTILATTTGAQNFTLSAANSMQGFIADETEEMISAPTNVMCLDANTSGSTWSVISCGVARGRTITATIERIQGASIDVGQSQTAPGFTVTLSTDPGLIDGDSIVISGLSGTVGGLDLSQLNARWAPIWEVGATGGKYSFQLISPLATGKGALDATGLSGTLTARQWRSSFTIPNSLTVSGSSVNITSKDIRTRIYSRNIISGQATSSYRAQNLSDWGISNGVQILTTKTGDPSYMRGAWWNWSIVPRALCGSAATTGNFSGAVVTSLSGATAISGCGSVQVSRRSETAWGGQPGWDYRWADVTDWEVASNVVKLYLSADSQASFTVGDVINVQGFQTDSTKALNGKAAITAVAAASGGSGPSVSFARTMPNSAKQSLNGWENVSSSANIDTDPTGVFRGDLPLGDGVDQIVQLTYNPRGNSTLVSSATVFKITVADGFVTSARYCDASYDVQSGTCTGSWVVAPTSSSRYLLLVREANFIGKIIDPTGNAVAPEGNTGQTWVEVQQLQTNGSTYYFAGGSTGSSNGVDGVFKLRLSAGSYKLRAGSPQGKNFPPVEVFLKVAGSGSSATFQRCTTFDSSASSESAALTGCTSAVASVDSPFGLQYGSADLQGTLQLTNGSSASNAWIELSKPSSNCQDCWDWIGGSNTNSTGQFSMNFASAGTYRLTANPPFNDTSGSVRTTWTATVTISGSTKTVTIGGDSDGTVVLTMEGSNFKGKVLKSGSTAAGFAWTEFQKFNDDQQRYLWSNTSANANASGEFNANLTTGKWKIVSRPSPADSGTFSASTFYAYVNTSDEPDTIRVNTSEDCAVSSPATGCSATAISQTDGRYGLTLGSPNVSGYVAKTSTATRATSGAPSATDALSFVWIEVQKYNEFEGDYRWSADVGGASTSSAGQFSLRLPEGKWRLSVNPRPLDTIAGLSRANFDVTVAANGTVTCDRAYTFCTSGGSPATGRFDLHLASANLSGTVTADGTGVDQAQIRVERWNGSWWQWANMWANTSNSGSYALNLETEGAYKITAEIASWKTNAGFSPTSVYVYKAASALCALTESQVSTATSCPAGSGASLTANIALTGSNVKGLVKKASDNSAVGNTWANILRWNNDFNNWEWVQGTPVSSTGGFNATLRSTLGETAATAQRYRIEIFPPWGTTSLTRKVVDLWVGDLEDDNPASHTYVICSAASISGCDLSSGNIKSSASTLNVLMSGGNITGTITGPSSATAANPYVNVEKWTTPSWSSNKMWVWTQINGQGTASGAYSLDTGTECSSSETTCFFRITANPGWVNPNSWSRVSTIIQVQASDGAYRSATQSDDFSQPAGSGSYGSAALNFTLVGSNVTGTVKNGAATVANTWIGLLKKESAGFYRWIGGANTNNSGGFGISTVAFGAGRYRLEVNPPWNSTLSRFSTDIVVASNGTFGVCSSTTDVDADCTGSSTNFTLSFPTANLAIRVCDKDDTGSTCTGIGNAFVNIFSSGAGGSHVTGSNTQTNGIARFVLANGTYRGEANPNWSNPDGTRVEFTFTISGGVLSSPSSASGVVVGVDQSSTPRQLDVRLGSPNVNGTVKYDHDANASTATQAMPNAWVSVRSADGSTWYPGTSTMSNGQFKLDLAAGNYVLTAYPNNSLAQKQPLEARITVAISGSTTTITETGSEATWDGVLDFDARTINVQFTLTDVGVSARQVLILNSSGTDLVGISSVTPNASGNAVHKLALPAGTYVFKIQKLLGDFASGGETCRSTSGVTVTVTNGLDSTANSTLNSWGSSFDATGDVLACKS
jgi:hypothetical protein